MDIQKLCGAIPSPPDIRDYAVKTQPDLPNEARVRRMPVIKRQLAGSCVAHSMAYCMEILTGCIFGAGFVYGFRPEGYFQSPGMIPREAAKTVTSCGNVLLSTFSTETELPAMKASVDKNISKLLRYAKKRKAAAYGRCYTANDIKTAIVQGIPAAFAACVSEYKCGKGGVFHAEAPVYGHHEMTVVGYRGDMFRVANSWGSDWGDNGFCWMSAEDVLRAGDIITLCTERSSVVLQRTLRNGMAGEDVRLLEERLNHEPGIKLRADGVFNKFTEKAVTRMQKELGQAETGMCNAELWNALGL